MVLPSRPAEADLLDVGNQSEVSLAGSAYVAEGKVTVKAPPAAPFEHVALKVAEALTSGLRSPGGSR